VHLVAGPAGGASECDVDDVDEVVGGPGDGEHEEEGDDASDEVGDLVAELDEGGEADGEPDGEQREAGGGGEVVEDGAADGPAAAHEAVACAAEDEPGEAAGEQP